MLPAPLTLCRGKVLGGERLRLEETDPKEPSSSTSRDSLPPAPSPSPSRRSSFSSVSAAAQRASTAGRRWEETGQPGLTPSHTTRERRLRLRDRELSARTLSLVRAEPAFLTGLAEGSSGSCPSGVPPCSRNATCVQKARPMRTTPEIVFQRLIDMAFAFYLLFQISSAVASFFGVDIGGGNQF